nr:zinc finger, CCHC-type [Tanacetum cinerariifolium]
MESEFVALAAAGKEAEWLKNLLLELPFWSKPIVPIFIRCDSVVTLEKAYSQMYNDCQCYAHESGDLDGDSEEGLLDDGPERVVNRSCDRGVGSGERCGECWRETGERDIQCLF